VADGHTGALFLLSVAEAELTYSWGCLDMKEGGRLLRLGASESASTRLGGAFLRLVTRRCGRIKSKLRARYIHDADDTRRFGHGFLFSENLLMDWSLLCLIIL
jgi:hypothetical protein